MPAGLLEGGIVLPLIVVPTPIGNLEDITLRALRVLRECDLVACEDTRRTLILLRRYAIRKPMLSCHEHNERARTEKVLALLEEGKTVALVSDAGTPGISDPGTILLAEALSRGFDVDVLPGATALIPALLLSGLVPSPFAFLGFLPDREGERVAFLGTLRQCPWTLVFYLSPHKAAAHLASVRDVLGNRSVSVVREISKIHQEVFRGSAEEALERAEEGMLRGELVLLVEGAVAAEGADEEIPWEEDAQNLQGRGLPLREVANFIHERYGIPKNVVKDRLLRAARRERDLS
ncbi:16S rRNA (cytidine(1402)-2'-O)-methyltransferase [Aminiphilus circumscriptus]|jgi:16S rRNA (cytidine1402-2'-O)-methyltransferase|uniref:16S rRNA (cytidine(1402)-2'-O)-methyltransferase n=1 Tax=Aminiphilus circumscriptus TaxID=290732 RepID=UPI0004BA4057|nr:16S rRNA (cytidine(1402)-2'-O)-methyltransferase [Aminiphilus circumscriptus]